MEKSKVGLVVLVALVAGLLGYFGGQFQGGGSFGAGITASNALNQQRLINEFAALASSTANIAQGSATQNQAILGPANTATSSLSGTITVTGAVVKDGCILGLSTSTTNAVGGCLITAANTATYWITNATTTAVTFVTSTVYATNVPNATFVAPTGL